MNIDVEMPKISEDELTQEQKGIMQDLINRYEFPNQLVLKAFEECKDNPEKYDIQNWCLENFGKYGFVEDTQKKDFSDEEEEEDRYSDVSSMDSEAETLPYHQQNTPLSVTGMCVCVCVCVCVLMIFCALIYCLSFHTKVPTFSWYSKAKGSLRDPADRGSTTVAH